nr:unnamed protein product [Digitaria exilis]
MSLSRRSRGERGPSSTSEPTGQQHLYVIFDDWGLGYSIRKLNLSNASNAGAEQRCLRRPFIGCEAHRYQPRPFIRVEATRGSPEFFAAVGTKILATHPREDFCTALVPGGILPMIDVRSRGLNFAPGELYREHPIYLPVGDEEIFALDLATFKMLSMKPLWPPRLEHEYRGQTSDWSWCNLPMPRFNRMDVTSYALDSDGRTILTSTAAATFAFDTQRREWKRRVEWSLPFSGRAYFVHDLDVFVGLPRDEDDVFGHLCFCRWLDGDEHQVWFSKEKLSTKDPAEKHQGTTLVYLGKSRFCLVECVDHTATVEFLRARCCLKTFSLGFDMNGET